MRFRPEQHLRRQRDIRAARELGRRLDCRAFTVWCREREPGEIATELGRATAVASIAAVGPAVQRNRAKRRLREIFRRHQDVLPRGCDWLMVSKAAVNRRSFAELEKTFVETCGKAARSTPPAVKND
jgi:ribonuclease P protein component